MHVSSTRHLCCMRCNRRMIVRATNPEASWDIYSVWFASLLGKSLSLPWPWAGTVPCMALASGDARLAYTQTAEREDQADVKVLSSGILVDWVHNASWKLPCSMQNQRSRVNSIHIAPACMHIYAYALQLSQGKC